MSGTIGSRSANGSIANNASHTVAPANIRRDLHPATLEISSSGVADYLYPIDDSDDDRFCDQFAERLTQALRSRSIDKDRMAEALWLVLISIIFEGTTLFRLARLSRRLEERGIRASWGGEGSALEQIGRRAIPESAILRMFLVGPSHSRLRSPWIRWLGSLARRDGYSRRPRPLLDPMRDALCLVGGAPIQAIADAENKRLVLSRFEHWIDLKPGWRDRMPEIADKDAIEEVVQIADATFGDAGEVMPANIRASLTATVRALARVALKSLGDVEAHAKHLPRLFLTGSTSQVQNRAIARVVQKEGGSVATFDHGVGGGWRRIPTLTTTLWDSPNRYVTFTQTHADGIRRLIEPRYKVSEVGCEPVASLVPILPPASKKSEVRRQRKNACSSRVMYVPTLYVGERYYAPGLPADITVVDFQARLFSYLKDRGHELVIKPHPECTTGIRPELAAVADARIESRLFDQVAEDAGVLMFDCPSSTTFRTAVCTSVPIVLLDHGRVPITEHAYALIKKRAAIVVTERTDDNRINLDWSELDRALEEASELRDPSFANLYFGAEL